MTGERSFKIERVAFEKNIAPLPRSPNTLWMSCTLTAYQIKAWEDGLKVERGQNEAVILT